MYSPAIQPLIPDAHQSALERLSRTLRLSQDQFSIILVQASSPLMRQWVLDSLRQTVATQIKELVLHPTVTNLFATIKRSVEHPKSSKILSVVGLNNLDHLEAALRKMNFERDRFQQELHCPIIFWIDEHVSRKLRRAAPDFSNCLTAPIQFTTEGTELFRIKPTPKIRRAMNAAPVSRQVNRGHQTAPRQDTVTYSQPQQLAEIPTLLQVIQREQTLIVNLELLPIQDAQNGLEQLVNTVQKLGGSCQKVGQQIFLFRLEPNARSVTR